MTRPQASGQRSSSSRDSRSTATTSSAQLALKAEHLSQAASNQASTRKRPRGSFNMAQDGSRSEDDDEGGDGDDQDEDGGGSQEDEQNQPSRTRRRVATATAEEGADRSQPQSGSTPGSSRQHQLAPLMQRSSDGFLPGSIKRVALYQFVTYDFVEFHPGPHLNMIIGPNGTGKSTIASGIALGLGWSPAVLSRQKDLADFVKNDCQDGWIELELQGMPGQRNIVIRRTLVKTGNRSDWFLNGRKSTKTEVLESVSDFEIDISNLCSFLPQDNVAAFARMSTSEVLRETEKMAGDPRLLRWHNKLTSLGAELAAKEATLGQDVKQRDNLKERNEALERDVRRFEEREKMEQQIYLLKYKIAKVEYDLAVADALALRAEKDRTKQALREAEEALAPIRSRRDELKSHVSATEDKLKRQREATRTAERNATKIIRDLEQHGVEIEQLHDRLKRLKSEEDQRKKGIRDLKAEIAKRDEVVRSGPPEVDLTEIKLQIRSVDQELREVEGGLMQVHGDKREVSIESDSLGRSRDELKRELESLDDVKAQRLERLRQGDPVAHAAVLWLRQNQRIFQKPVYEPILLEINVTDPAYADAVEACINWPLMKTFVCQTRADYDLFTREVIDKQRMRVTVAELEGKDLSRFQPPVPQAELQAFGLDKYVLDVLAGPPEVLVYLCQNANLHSIPIARSEANVNVERIEASQIFRRFVIGKTNFTITYAAYGNKAAQTASRLVPAARNLARSIDERQKQQLDGRIRAVQQKISEQEAKMTPLLRTEARLKKEQEDIQRRKAELLGEKRAKEGARSDWEKSKVDLDRLRRRLTTEEQRPGLEEQRMSCLSKRRKVVKLRAQKAQQLKGAMQDMLRAHPEADVLSFEKLQLETNQRHVDALLDEHKHAQRELEEQREEASKQYEVSKKKLKRLREVVTDLLENPVGPPIESEAEVEESLEDLQANLSRQEAAYQNAQGIRPGVKEQFDERKREIASLDEKIQKLESVRAAIEGKLQSVKAKWQPALGDLVSKVSEKFSQAFDNLGCAGEIRLKEAEKYEDWAIEILVQFRTEGSLQVLNAQQQSGGERSLSTIMYLMSLCELSRAPFSLVDEINQGMDQRAERNVHNHMVEVTCQPSASQYFLITPKLLTDLRYHPQMRVLIVNNGDWAPKKSRLHDYVAKARRTGVTA